MEKNNIIKETIIKKIGDAYRSSSKIGKAVILVGIALCSLAYCIVLAKIKQ